jgi:hypothetical protein
MLKVVVLSVQFKKTLALKNYVNAAEVKGGQIDAIGIAGTVLHRAGDSDHLLNPGVIGRDLIVRNRPIHVVPIER